MLDFLISPAAAQAAAQPSGPAGFLASPMFFLIFMLVMMYFLIFRPQMKRSREVKDMLGKLAKGDEVITSGGLTGVLRELGENFVTVEIADNVSVKLQKSAIVSVLPKGTLKAH